MACSARFERIAVTLTVQVVNATGGRNVSSQPVGIDCSTDGVQDCAEDFAPNVRVVLRASPSGFLSWQGCDRVLDVNFFELTLAQPRSVIASFSP